MTMRVKKLNRTLAMFIVFAILASTANISTSAHELSSNVSARWSTVRAIIPTNNVSCILRFGAHSSATSKLVMAYPAASVRWNNASNRITLETGTTNVMLASSTTFPKGISTNAVAYTALKSRSWGWLNTILDATIIPGNYLDCNYAEIWTFPLFESSNISSNFRSAIVTHEIGHVVGLGHLTNTSTLSVMQSTNSNPGFRETPQSHDLNDLNAFY